MRQDTTPSARDPIAQHRRDVRLAILGPLLGSGALLIALVGGLGLLVGLGQLTPRQLSTMASLMAVICLLVPLAVVVVLINAAVLVVAYGSGKLPHWTAGLLRPLRGLIQRVNAALLWVIERAPEPIITIKTQLERWTAFLTELLHFFGDDTADDEETAPVQDGGSE